MRLSIPQVILALSVSLSTFAYLAWAEVTAASSSESGIKGEVISSSHFERKQVGGGKAVIEIFKEGKGAFLGRLTVAPNGVVPTHRDPTEEYLVIERGAGTLTMDGVVYQVRAGQVIYMPANAEVSFKNGPEPLIALQVFAGPESARKYDAWEPAP